MDSESQRRLEECVLRILKHGDPNKLTESKVRKLAADETGFDLTDPANRKTVKRTVENYFSEDGSHPENAAQTKVCEPKEKQPPLNPGRRRNSIVNDNADEKAERHKYDTRSTGNPEECEQPDASVESEEEDERKRKSRITKKRRADDTEDEEVVRVNGQKHTVQRLSESKNFPSGDDPVCQLSKNRFVIVQDFNGKTLVSIREYYEKDGNLLPTRKGISLTVEQWEALKTGLPDIEAAIKYLR
ncbi:unnamed protein product [Calypogeia fissa]